MSSSRKELGNIIREARATKGLTVRGAAEKLRLDPGYYSKIENGQVALGKHAKAVARLYGLNAEELSAMSARTLPNFAPYLRAKYDLSEEAVAELEAHFAEVTKVQPKRRRLA
jgi:transcriptional regulator with XRE-family HTH domain